MFKFNFYESEYNQIAENCISDLKQVTWLESKEIIPSENMDFSDLDTTKYNEFKCNTGKICLKYFTNDGLVEAMKEKHQNNSILYADQNHSDLVTGVYEGGLKIWECTQDLFNFVCIEQLKLSDRNVLDLGCGLGIIGIYSLLNGAQVHFQDYNPEVIKSATIPNVVLNVGEGKGIGNIAKFYCGDWQSFSDIMSGDNTKFDYIFSSETIYNVGNYSKLHTVFENCLKHEGIIYLAAKTYYFGVGGGLRSFEDFVKSKGLFNIQSVWMYSDGINREILRITWK